MIVESLLIEVFWGGEGLQILIFVSLVVELNGHDDMEGHDNKALFGAVKTRSEISSLVWTESFFPSCSFCCFSFRDDFVSFFYSHCVLFVQRENSLILKNVKDSNRKKNRSKQIDKFFGGITVP